MKPTHFLILDRAHGDNVSGKQSPDGKHKEYIYSNALINTLRVQLERRGIPFGFTAYDNHEPGLETRVRRANDLAIKAKQKGLIPLLVSLHNNAASKEGWSNATGIEVFTTIGQTKSDQYAELLYEKFADYFPEVRLRCDYSDGDADKEANFAVLKGKEYRAILVEFLFQDSKIDIPMLMSEEVFGRYIDCLCDFFDTIQTWTNS